MNLGNMLSFMATDICVTLKPVWTIFGYLIFAVKVIVPLLLIITGMIALAQAVMKQEEKEIKKAQSVLIQKLIAAVLVYLVITITGVVVGLVADGLDWQECANCAFHPFNSDCGITGDVDTGDNGPYNKDTSGNSDRLNPDGRTDTLN